MTGRSHVPFVPAAVSQQPIHAAHYAARHPAYQPAQRHNATAAIIAGSQSLYQKRATDVLAEFDTLRAACIEPVSRFVFSYSCCEALALLLVGSREPVPVPPHKLFEPGVNVVLRKTKSAVKRLHLRVSDRRLNLLFQAKARTGHRSCRMLRNGVLHGLRRDFILEVRHRHVALNREMGRFIEAIRSVAQRGHHF
jgi:hypothetical protein